MILGLDLTPVAALRMQLGPSGPDPVEVAMLASLAGARSIGITVKGERSPVTERDGRLLRDALKVPFVLKIPTSAELVKFALALKPASVVLLPERREDLPLEEGLDLILNQSQVKRAVQTLREAGIQVLAFINPSIDQVKSCHKLDIGGVELNALKFAESGRDEDVEMLRECARLSRKLGMRTWTGRGLTEGSIERLASIQEIDEIHVGRLFLARAILEGAGGAVAWLKSVIRGAAR